MANAEATAILFPGQGVGDDSSRELVERVRPDLLELAIELVGDDPYKRIADGTRYSQPAVYCASIAGFAELGSPASDYFAGHSLGEIGALAAAGAIDHEDGLRIVAARGRAMEEAVRHQPPGGMLAVGADRRYAESLAADTGLAIANENSPQQFVLSGELKALEAAATVAKAEGVRAKRLAVAGAFHTTAMEPAIEPLRRALEGVEFRAAHAPVYSSTTARLFEGDPRSALAASLTSPIRWVTVVRNLHRLGVRRYLDVGPGKVLAGLVRRTIDDVQIETLASQKLGAGSL